MEFEKLLKTVFNYKKGEKVLFLCDIPKGDISSQWKDRLVIAETLSTGHLLATYDATNSNNADLPSMCNLNGRKIAFDDVFRDVDIVIALTEFSATAPLHKYAERYGLKVASMPGFNDKMIKALEIDFSDLKKKIERLYSIFKSAEEAEIVFHADGKDYPLFFDLSHRDPIKDDSDCTRKGTVINLPSGECFIAPYDKEDSRTEGYLPIEKDGILVIYKVEKNSIVSSDRSSALMDRIRKDKAVGNIAELAFGVLSLYGIKPCGRTLLDEKLGMHIALGRNDHFGGNVSPSSFLKKENVWHQDYVYIKEMQTRIIVKSAKVGKTQVIKDGKYVVF